MSGTPEPIERNHAEAPAEGEDWADAPAEGDRTGLQEAPSGSRAHAQEPAEGARAETIPADPSSGKERGDGEG